MPINFPSNPNTNDTYTLGNKTWKFNGDAWELVPLTAGYTGSQGYTGSKGDTGFVGSKGDTGYTGSAGSSTTLYWDLGNQNNPDAVAAIECGDQTRYITNIFDSGGTN